MHFTVQLHAEMFDSICYCCSVWNKLKLWRDFFKKAAPTNVLFMQITCVDHYHTVVVRDIFNTLLPNEKQLDTPDIHATITTLLIMYNSPLMAVFLSEAKCWSTATAVQLNPPQLHWIPRWIGQMESRCVKGITTKGVNRNLQPRTEKVKVSSGQSKRREARNVVERGSLDKDWQNNRISLSHSRGRRNKLRLQREWDRVRGSLEKSVKAAKFITQNSYCSINILLIVR